MAESTFAAILNKIRSISKECDVVSMPEFNTKNESEINVEGYLKVLDSIRGQLIRYRQLQDQYTRLEAILQKAEADLRQKAGFEQQIKLYNDSLKSQIEELQFQKLELLQNSKLTIKELKKVNQQLFLKLNAKANKVGQKQDLQNSNNEAKGSKTERKRSLGGKTTSNVAISSKVKANGQDQLKQIIKTEYIQRQQMGGSTRNNIGVVSEEFVQGAQGRQLTNLGENGNKGGKTDRQIIISKKRQRNMYSNNNLFNFVRSNRRQQQRQLKEIYLPKTPEKKGEAKKAKGKYKNLVRSLWKDKLAVKSVHSIASMQPVVSNKETL